MRLFKRSGGDAVAHWRKRPGVRLVEHFLRALVGGDPGAPGESAELGVAPMLALLALPGAFAAFFLFDKYSSLKRYFYNKPAFDVYAASIPDKYFFVVLGMTITAGVAVMRWDRLLPTREDFARLTPLPLAPATIFLANFAAVVLTAVLFALDANLASAVLFPVVVLAERALPGTLVEFALQHAAAMFLASLFSFLAALAAMGLVMAVTPARWLARVSVAARLGLVTVCVTGLLSVGLVAPRVARLDAGDWMAWLPPVWFTALYQSWQGHARWELAGLAGRAWWGLAGAMVAMTAFYGLSYRRHFRRTAEMATPELRRGRVRLGWGRTGFERAAGAFAVRTLLRSEKHLLMVGSMMSLGLVVCVGLAGGSELRALPDRSQLAAPVVMLAVTMAAVRMAFDVPVELGANWQFRMLIDPERHAAARVARGLVLAAAGLVVIPACLATGALWGLNVAMIQAAVLAGLAWVGSGWATQDYARIPFTYPLAPPRETAMAWGLGMVAALTLATEAITRVEARMLREPWWIVGVVGAVGLGLLTARVLREDEVAARLTFSEPADAVTTRMGLLDG